MKRRSLRLVLCTLAAVAIIACGTAAAQTVNLAAIRAVGSERYAEAEIIRASGLTVGTEVSPQDLQEAIDRLAESGVFAAVSYRAEPFGAALAVEFHVADAAQFLHCRFDNFVWFSKKQLREELVSRVPLFRDQIPVTGRLSELIVAALSDLLREQGVRGRVASYPSGPAGGEIGALLFRVEGVVIPIRRVTFPGAAQLDLALLEVASQPLLQADYRESFVRIFAELDLRPLYLQRGYLRVFFEEPIAELVGGDPGEPTVNVAIPIREGSQYLLGELLWLGNTVSPSSELAEYITLTQGHPANAIQLQDDVEKVSELYGTRGYVRAVVQRTPTIDDAERTVSYELRVREGDLYRMGELEITGLDAGSVERLRGAWRLPTGAPFDTSYLDRFFREIPRYLPRSRLQNLRVSRQQSVDENNKTVNISIQFLPQSGR